MMSSNGAHFVRLMISILCHIDDDDIDKLFEPDIMFENVVTEQPEHDKFSNIISYMNNEYIDGDFCIEFKYVHNCIHVY